MTNQGAVMSKTQWIKENLKAGESYAGIILGKKGQPDYHLVLLADKPAIRIKWQQAMDWAKSIGGTLPDRCEQSLLFANLKELFDADWYWSCEQRADYSGYAWSQHFPYGDQDNFCKSNEYRAVAVRRVIIK